MKMKKFLALTLALVMALGLAACSNNGGQTSTPPAESTPAGSEPITPVEPSEPADTTPAELSADQIEDNMTSADGTYEIAFITDVGQLKDKSFNQGTYDGVKLYAAANGLSYKYYQPANGDQATDDDRYDAMKAAVDAGAKVVVCAGFMQENALRQAASEFTDVPFVFIDGYPLADKDGNTLTNVAAVAFMGRSGGY